MICEFRGNDVASYVRTVRRSFPSKGSLYRNRAEQNVTTFSVANPKDTLAIL